MRRVPRLGRGQLRGCRRRPSLQGCPISKCGNTSGYIQRHCSFMPSGLGALESGKLHHINRIFRRIIAPANTDGTQSQYTLLRKLVDERTAQWGL